MPQSAPLAVDFLASIPPDDFFAYMVAEALRVDRISRYTMRGDCRLAKVKGALYASRELHKEQIECAYECLQGLPPQRP
jgi:hypothetical protein